MNDSTSTTAPPPRGFKLSTARGGENAILYRTTGMGCAGIFFAVWLTGWTAACLAMTYAFFFKEGSDWSGLIFLIPFWTAEIVVLAYALWFFCSVTTFTFHPDRLQIERVLLGYRREHSIPKTGIHVVRQLKDGGSGKDSFPSWGLVIEGESNVRLLSRQPIEKSAWFGPIVASWAGVKYEPSEVREYAEI